MVFRKQEVALDVLTIALCLSIGSGVPWLMAIYSEFNARKLIWNTAFSMVGVTLCAVGAARISPTYAIVALVAVGPLCALFTIVAGQRSVHLIARSLAKSRGAND
jgi:hypothetical protein